MKLKRTRFLFFQLLTLTCFACSDKVVTRKNELILEGLINDICYRHKVRYQLKSLNCYASVNLNQIVVYFYPENIGDVQYQVSASETERKVRFWKQEMPKLINSTLLSFPDFQWAQKYEIFIVDGTSNVE